LFVLPSVFLRCAQLVVLLSVQAALIGLTSVNVI